MYQIVKHTEMSKIDLTGQS